MKTDRQKAYAIYLQSEHWKALRMEVLIRDGFRCVRCPSRKRLQAHHKVYHDRFEDSVADELITLCQPCHKREHGIKPDKKPFVTRAQLRKPRIEPVLKQTPEAILSEAERLLAEKCKLRKPMRKAIAVIARNVYFVDLSHRAKAIQRLWSAYRNEQAQARK